MKNQTKSAFVWSYSAILLGIVFLFLPRPTVAVQPSQWSVSTQKEFLEGELHGFSLTSQGLLIPSAQLQEIFNAQQAFIYSAVADKAGNIFIGTGSNGKVFRVTPDGQATLWADFDEPNVYALAVDTLNRVYAATAPDGKVYRIDDKDKFSVFFDPSEKYIWALAMDRSNNLYVGTGPKGVIYKVDGDGKSSLFYDSKETHVVSLAWDLDGNLLAGTSPRGLLMRISPQGSAFVLYDSPLDEISAIAVDRIGDVYAAGVAAPKSSQDKNQLPPTRRIKKATERQGEEQEPETIKVAGATKGTRSEIYKVDKQDLVDVIYSSDTEMAFDLLMRDDGNLLVATGGKGRILSIDPRKFVTYLTQSTEEQVTQMLMLDKSLYVVTSNLGRVFKLTTEPGKKPTYLSKVFDAKIPSSWGLLRWNLDDPTASGVTFYSRSGNTASPDNTWSKWSSGYTDPKGSSIKSPPARFLQWKIEVESAATSDTVIPRKNAVDRVTVTYLQHNMAPRLLSLTVYPPGVAFIRTANSDPSGGISPGGPRGAHLLALPRYIRDLNKLPIAPPPRKVYMPGARSLSWSADDPNNDDLDFRLYYRRQDETNWKLLAKELTDTHYTLDGASFPDGTYFIKVVASDHLSNPPDHSRESELVSKGFVISNSSPTVEFQTPQVSGNGSVVAFTTRTHASTVFQTEYSVDGSDWTIVYPVDGIADSENEQYRVSLKGLQSGEHIFAVRVVDSVGNLGTAKTAISVR